MARVVLPASADPPGAARQAAGGSGASEGERRQRVLLVDDEPLVAQTMERLLRRDYDITVARTAREAIELIAGGGARFDAIVCDVMMPNMTGIELVEGLQRIAPDQAQRLIFLSGGAFTAQTRERLDQLGAPQLEKPVTASELRACVLQITREVGPVRDRPRATS
jgi:CheY-like chemotaxis protein